jgi:ADP-L-glycero-D-manno-heptose 6-epimerase
MKILLTGHQGFIGSNMLQTLINQGHDVDTFEWGDLYSGVLEYDWVVHLGAISSTTERDINKVLTQNYDFTCRLFDDCRTFGVNLQYSSSASVYGLGSVFSEDAPPDPRSPYAWSKYLVERYHAQHQGGNIVQGFRYFNVYGPGEDHKGDQASPYHKFEQQAKHTGIIKLFENSDQFLRDFVPVQSIVDAHLKFFDVEQSGVWNVGSGRATSFESVARMIADQYNARVEYVPMPDNLVNSYQRYTCADMTKFNNTI